MHFYDCGSKLCTDFIRVLILTCHTGNAASNKQSKSSDLVVGAEKIENDTEFVILASSGIWEVRCAFGISLPQIF